MADFRRICSSLNYKWGWDTHDYSPEEIIDYC